jgi:hypothetical protein
VCPYQPKLTRRPGEPMPEMRSASIQVEMDEVRMGKHADLTIEFSRNARPLTFVRFPILHATVHDYAPS